MISRLWLQYFKERIKKNGLSGVLRYYFSPQFINWKRRQVVDYINQKLEKKIFSNAERGGFNRAKKKIYFLFNAWGEYFDYFFYFSLPSIMQPGNVPSLLQEGYELEIFVYVNEDQVAKQPKKYEEQLQSARKILPIHMIPVAHADEKAKNDILIDSLIAMIRKCLKDDAMLFHLAGDVVIGNHSLANAVKLVQGKGICLAAGYPRVDRDDLMASGALKGLQEGTRVFENDELVDLAFQYSHGLLSQSFDNKDENATLCGASLRKINNRMYSVVHNVPNVYLANFTKRDLEFFEQERRFNQWDRAWTRMLFSESRIKLVGSSDLFFALELTAKNDSVDLGKKLLNNDFVKSFEAMRLHNHIANSCYCLWRARNGSAG